MATTKFNARHGLSVGSTPVDVVNDAGLIASTSIPELDASKITTGTISADRLPTIVTAPQVFAGRFLMMGA